MEYEMVRKKGSGVEEVSIYNPSDINVVEGD
jgi:hypothetical protein